MFKYIRTLLVVCYFFVVILNCLLAKSDTDKNLLFTILSLPFGLIMGVWPESLNNVIYSLGDLGSIVIVFFNAIFLYIIDNPLLLKYISTIILSFYILFSICILINAYHGGALIIQSLSN